MRVLESNLYSHIGSNYILLSVCDVSMIAFSLAFMQLEGNECLVAYIAKECDWSQFGLEITLDALAIRMCGWVVYYIIG